MRNVLLLAGLLLLPCAIPPCAAQGSSSQKMVLEGVITKRDPDSITVRDARGSEVVVAITSATKVKERKSNPFRGAKEYAVTQLVRGLNVEVKATQAVSGQPIAREIRMKDIDLRVATSIQSRVEPVETKLNEVDTRLQQTEQNAQRLSGQIEEVSTIANSARNAAKAAQETGDAAREAGLKAAEGARAEARAANNRISALDDYDVKTSVNVLFRVGSAQLSEEAAQQLNDLAKQAESEKGYLIEVTGYASSDGSAAANQRLSQRRAEVVIRYLTAKHAIPLRRLVTPFGFGAANPVAPNDSRDGRKQNRRVEVRVLVNKALSAAENR